MTDISEARERMVERQIAGRGIRDARVLQAMRQVPRERFVDREHVSRAYDDEPLPIDEGQTISQPYIVALMVEAAALKPGEHVLEVGAGSGYAAAVMAEIAGRVIAIERHRPLGEAAARRLADAGYDNVSVRIGDGSLGWPEGAPFDAIIVSAGAPVVPEALKEQLAVGGRLLIPVGEADSAAGQNLLRITRTGRDTWDEDRISAVRFVPLIGAEGYAEDGRRPARAGRPVAGSPPATMAEAAEPLPEPDDPAFAAAFDRYGDARVVLLGEASHGTSEFYRARAAITRRLVERHGFNIVAVEADWPDAATVDAYVAHRTPREGAEPAFRRFPTWMWRNAEVEGFIRWLRGHNDGVRDVDRRTGFYGLDLYNLQASISTVLSYLDDVDPEAAQVARERYGCLTPWQDNPAGYGRAVLHRGHRDCRDAVVAQLRDLLERQLDHEARDGASFLDAAQSARLIRSAERYYRAIYSGGAEGWNQRDRHMFETLEHLLEARGPEAKAVVWAHNSHIGDARETEMGREGQLNIGQLTRERWGDEAVLIGFGTHTGTVAAASDWNGEMEVKQVRPSLDGSYERLSHDTGVPRFLLDMRDDDALPRDLLEERLERMIGVIYRPETERASHYVKAALHRQFDAWVWFDQTRAVTPLDPAPGRRGLPETWPFGV